MVTTVAPSATSGAGSKSLLSPVTSAPPWIHTMTGKCEPACWWRGVKTFRNRQSSDVLAWPKGDGGCGQCGANCVASRTPDQRLAGCGGCHRSAPTGGAAYGMPRNSLTAPFARPRTGPLVVSTTGPAAAACPPVVLALTAGAAATTAPRVTPAAASRVCARHPVQDLNIGVSLQRFPTPWAG